MLPERERMLSERAVSAFRRRVLPLIFLAYLMNFIDRSNIGYAYLKMGADIGISAAAYGLGAGLFFIGYVISGVPGNLVLKQVGARRWIAFLVIAWGSVSTVMSCIQGPASFYGLRVLLGIVEGGFVPALNFYVACWIPPGFRSRINGIIIGAIPIGLTIGGPLAGLLLGIQHPVAGWRSLFVVEGSLTVLLGFIIFRFLPDSPETATWLHEDERHALRAVMDAETNEQDSAFAGSWLVEFKVFGQYRLIGQLFILLSAYAATFAMIYFMPTILEVRYHLTPFEIGSMTTIPNLVSLLASYLMGRSSERFADLRWHLFVICVVGSIGFFTLNLASSLASFLAVTSAITAFTIAYFAPLNTAIQNIIGRRPAPLAFVTTIASIGGFLGPRLMGTVIRQTHGDWSTATSIFGALLLVAAALALACVRNPRTTPVRVDTLPATK